MFRRWQPAPGGLAIAAFVLASVSAVVGGAAASFSRAFLCYGCGRGCAGAELPCSGFGRDVSASALSCRRLGIGTAATDQQSLCDRQRYGERWSWPRLGQDRRLLTSLTKTHQVLESKQRLVVAPLKPTRGGAMLGGALGLLEIRG